MILTHLYVEGGTLPYRTPLRSPSTREADGRRSGSTALTTAIGPEKSALGEAENTRRRLAPPLLYSPDCVEDEFYELRIDGVLGSSP